MEGAVETSQEAVKSHANLLESQEKRRSFDTAAAVSEEHEYEILPLKKPNDP